MSSVLLTMSTLVSVYIQGGGEIMLSVPVVRQLQPINAIDEGMVKRIRGVAYSMKVPPPTHTHTAVTFKLPCNITQSTSLLVKTAVAGVSCEALQSSGAAPRWHRTARILFCILDCPCMNPGVCRAQVSPQTSNRMVDGARSVINALLADAFIFTDHMSGPEAGHSPGYGIALVAETTSGRLISAECCPAAKAQVRSLPKEPARRSRRWGVLHVPPAWLNQKRAALLPRVTDLPKEVVSGASTLAALGSDVGTSVGNAVVQGIKPSVFQGIGGLGLAALVDQRVQVDA
jgi:RNA 3'-terminal phosphate cyclase (RTC), insert domain